MSEKKMKQFRREFRKTFKSGGKATSYAQKFKNILKMVSLSEERRALKNLLAENSKLKKKKRRSFFAILAEAPKAGAQYLRKSTRIEADDVRQQYQAQKKLFRYGHR